jgi:hypothetical protein
MFMQRKLWIVVALTGSPMGIIDYPSVEFWNLAVLPPLHIDSCGFSNYGSCKLTSWCLVSREWMGCWELLGL